MPVLSTSNCSGDLVRWELSSTCKVFWRRQAVLKSGAGQSNLANCSRLCTMPSACRKGWPNRHLMIRQNWVVTSEKFGLSPRLPLGVPSHHIPGSSHIVNAPCAFSAALYAFQFVVRYLLRCLFFVSVTPSVYGRRRGDLCNKARASRAARDPVR